MQRCDGDDSFGPALGSGLDCHNFDFTIFFEDCIFSLIPSILVIVAAAYRVFLLLKRPKIINWPVGEALKHVSGSFFLLLLPNRHAFSLTLCADWFCYSRGIPGIAGRSLESWLWCPDATHRAREHPRAGVNICPRRSLRA